MAIKSDRIHEILKDCLYREDEIVDGKPVVEPIIIDGIRTSWGIHSERIENHREEIQTF